MSDFRTKEFPKSRLASIDVCELGRRKHHVAALLEVDVTDSRAKIRQYRKEKGKISFTGWLLKTISATIGEHRQVAGFRKGKRKIHLFNDINLSVLVEKEIDGQKVPFPVVIEKASEKSLGQITTELHNAKNELLDKNSIVLQRQSSRLERLYYYFPAFIRRWFWRFILRYPNVAFSKMGNVSVTSIGMIGKVSGWFIPLSIHPVCFGIGSVIKKPLVVNDHIEIREVVNLTVLLDHDVLDGVPMARFISDLTKNIENGLFL